MIPYTEYENMMEEKDGKIQDLEEKIERILAKLDYGNLDELEKETARIREAIVGCKFPDDLADEIMKAYGELGGEPYVAVRSSGTAEDLEGASFAGQYDTYLDIKGRDALLDAVQRCWASMWTARVTVYRQDKGFDHTEAGIAIVVQTMVDADVAGVMFVGNPMNARADEILINASWGLGEAVVSGAITPDEYIVGRDALQVKRRTLGSKELRVVRDPETGNGTVQEKVPDDLQGQLLAFLDLVVDVLDVMLGEFGDVQQPFHPGQYFHEGAEVDDPRDLSRVSLADLGLGRDLLDDLDRLLRGGLVDRGDLDAPVVLHVDLAPCPLDD